MKRKKKSVVVTIVVLLLIAVAGQYSHRVWAEDNVPTYEEYLADYYIERTPYWLEQYEAPYRTFVDNGKANGLAKDCLAWRAATFTLSDLTSYSTKEIGYYQTILFDLLYEGEETGVGNAGYNKTKSVVKNASKFYKTVNVSALKELNRLSLVTTADTVITDDNLEQVLKDLQKDDYISRALKFVGTPKKYLGYISTVTDFVDRLAKVEALLQLSEDYAEIMKDMMSYTKSSATGLLLKGSLNDFQDLCRGTVTEEEITAVFVADEAVQVIGNRVLDNCWDAVLSLSSGVGLMINAGQTIGKYASNWMFSTDKIVETYYTMCALYDVEDALQAEVDACKKNYLGNKTYANAKKFNNAVRLLYRLHKIGIDYANDFVEVTSKGGELSKLFTYLDSSDYDRLTKQIESIKKSMSIALDELEDYVYGYYRDEYGKIVVEYDDLNTVEVNSIPSEEYVAYMNTIKENAFRCSNLTIDGVYVLDGDYEIYGDLLIKSGQLDLNGYTLTVGGDCFHTGGELEVGGGRLNLKGNYRLQDRTVDHETATTRYSSCSGNLVMDGEDDYICVEGDFVTQSSANYFHNSAPDNKYSAGILEIKGDFAQKKAIYGNGVNDTKNFVATEGHKVILSGKQKQKVSFESPADSYFSDLELENTNIEFIGNIRGWKLQRDTTFGNGLPNGMMGVLDLNGKALTVNGELSQTSGTINVNGGRLLVKGDYRIQSKDSDGVYSSCSGNLVMDGEDDYICVEGDFVTQSSANYFHNSAPDNKYSAGILEIKGDFAQKKAIYGNGVNDTKNFVATEGHKVILSGKQKQKVSFESPNDSCFANLEMRNENVEFVSQIKITNGMIHKNTVFGNGLPNGWLGTLDLNGCNVIMKGDFVQKEGKLLTNGGTLTVNGNYIKEEGDIIAAEGKVIVNGDYQSKKGTTTLSDKSSMTVNGTFSQSAGTIDVNAGVFMVSGDALLVGGTISGNKGSVSVQGSLTQTAGEMNLDQGTLTIDNDYILEAEIYDQTTEITSKTNSNGVLNMMYAADKLNINGNFIMHSGISHSGKLKAGTITLKGNFRQVAGSTGNFTATGANTVVFAGSEKQKISFDNYGSSGFNYVRFDNPNVEITTPIRGWTLQQDTEINSDIPGLRGTWDLNGYKLTIGGKLVQDAGTVNVNKGDLLVKKNYEIEAESYDQTTDITSKSNSSGSLLMKYAADRVEVDGDFIMHSNVNHGSNLISGILTLKGDFKQIEGSAGNFAASTVNKVIFAGEKQQNISFGSPSSSGFNDVEFVNENVKFLTAVKGWKLQRDTEIHSDIPGFSGTWDLDGNTLTIHGKFVQTGGVVNINKGTLHVTGNYEIESETYNAATDKTIKTDSPGSLSMLDVLDKVIIDGDFVIHSGISHNGKLTAGTMNIRGDFAQKNGSSTGFYATGTHTVILDGQPVQKVTFESENSQFNNLKIIGNKDSNYSFSRENCWKNLIKDINIDKVEIDIRNAVVKQGDMKQFKAEVTGQNVCSQEVLWSINGEQSGDTKISENGLLSIAPDETADSVIITVASVDDPTKTDSVTVIVEKIGVEVTPSPEPSTVPAGTPSPEATLIPTATPTLMPTKAPTATPTLMPTKAPTATPTLMPTKAPTVMPSMIPTGIPTITPTLMPTKAPTATPTLMPTKAPTAIPTLMPTENPTEAPTMIPTKAPTVTPTLMPTEKPTTAPTMMPTEIPAVTPTLVPTGKPDATDAPKLTEKSNETEHPLGGDVLEDSESKVSYKVLSQDEVAFYKVNNKKTVKIVIPATVTINGITYKVTVISNNAFSECKQLKSVIIGKYITTIGKKAFYGCKKLKSITIKTQKLKSKSVGKHAFKGIHKRAVIKVPKKQKKAYKKWLKKKGAAKTVKIK